METLKKYSKVKAELLHAKEQALLKSASSLQVKLLDIITDEFISKLDVENGYIKNTKANRDRIAALNRLFDRFQNNDFAKAVQTMVSDFKDIHTLNTGYFATINKPKVQNIEKNVFNKMKSTFGIEGNKITTGGFLDSFIKNNKLLSQLRESTFRAVTSKNITMKDYIKSVKLLTVGRRGVDGGFQKHFKTFATDAYTLFDRISNQEFATSLDLKYAVYAGGVIETTRPFCEVRNGKVFTTDEIAKFGTSKDKYGGYEDTKGNFKGKPKEGYDPFAQCGGYNCRHTLNYISKATAKLFK